MIDQPQVQPFLDKLYQPPADSHKGQNGKLMIIGGSELFHAAGKWALDAASKFVDMVFYSSVPSNNELIREAKGNFWNGIVVEQDQVTEYLDEADCVLIGPGMTRSEDTKQVVTELFAQYPHKKWVIDAGALQMVSPDLFPQKSILTPHHQELEILEQQLSLSEMTERGLTVLVTGQTDQIYFGEQVVEVSGGNAGMTKGGTGDVLAGVVAALYCVNDAEVAAVVGSYRNKKAGERLYEQFGPNFNASDLVGEVGKRWDLF